MFWQRWLPREFWTWLRHRRTPHTLGQRGETAAARYLRKQGYVIVARSQQEQLGEIDIVAVDDRTVVFVEVKTRESTAAGLPTEAVDADKQKRLTRLALGYLRRHDLLENDARFDVVSILWPATSTKPEIQHFENAFPAVGAGQMFN